MTPQKKRGYFITFEGAEGSGKSTQVKLLGEYLKSKNMDYICTREPGGVKISEQIRDILLNPENTAMSDLTEFLLYSAARSQHVFEKIKPAINDGKIVISDRFSFASFAYQGYGRGLDLNMIFDITNTATFGLEPDIIFLLDIDPEIGVEKAKIKSQKIFNTSSGGDRLENEDISFHNKVRDGYLELAKKFANVCLIKFDSIENIQNRIITELSKRNII